MHVAPIRQATQDVELVEWVRVSRINQGLFGTQLSRGVQVSHYRDGGPEPLLRRWKLRFTPDFGYGPMPMPGGRDQKIETPSRGQQAAIDALLGAVRTSGFDRITPDRDTSGYGAKDALRVEYYRADGRVDKEWTVPFGAAPQALLDVWRAAERLRAA